MRAKKDLPLAPQDKIQLPQSLDLTPQKTLPFAKETTQKRNLKTLGHLKEAICYKGAHEIVLNKPAGLAVQGGTNLKDALSWYLDDGLLEGEQLYIVHRLDQDTQGLLLLARGLDAARYYGTLFQTKELQKTYHAVVVGIPEQKRGTIKAPIYKGEGTFGREKMRALTKESSFREEESTLTPRKNHDVAAKDAAILFDLKEAVTHFEVIKTNKTQGFALLRLEIETGRKHQIRVHLSEVLKTPVLGDGKYGGRAAFPKGRTSLHLIASQLSFCDFSGHKQQITLDLPQEFEI